jgi:filamentous hemagglutinin family protein
MLFCTVGFVLLPTSYVWANPAGEQVVGGAATFQRDGNKLTVNQATDRLAVNWQSFNIAAGERTHFNMPSSTSAALNRVIGGNPSSIYGSLSANGILYLINPSGILVGPGGTVNAASFMASTLDVSTEQFMNAKNGAGMNFYGSSGESIINQGNITAEKGDVFLVAQKVENRGTINAANGTAGMVGSGQNTDVMVHEVGGNGFAIRVAQLQGEAATGSNRDLPDGEELLNEGSINAAQAELNASGNVYALAIKNSGTIRAKAVVANADGTVRLDGGLGDVMNTGTMIAKNSGNDATAAGGKIEVTGQNVTASPESIITAAGGVQGGDGGKVKIDSADTTIVQGKVDVAAPAAGAKGGKVELLGERVGLFDGAKVDASGGAGGGTVLVGGDYLGGQTPKPELVALAKQEAEAVKNAKATVMAEMAEIKADATVSGDGGKIILWSDEYTGFYGKLFASGGRGGGDGGFVETSSLKNLQAWGSVAAGSAKGNRGHWLLDPLNVTIAAATAGGTPADISTGGSFVPNALNATVSAAQIQTALGNNLDVTITTAGTAVDVDGNEVNQEGNITVANGITSTGNGNLTLTADNRVTVSAAINLSGGAGSVIINANGENIILNSTITSDVAVRLNASQNITLNAGIDVSGAVTGADPAGFVILNAGQGISGQGLISLPALQLAADAALGFTAGGDVFLNVSTDAELAVGDLGPAIGGTTTGGSVEIRNLGPALSTLTASGVRATAGIELIGGLGNLILNGQVFDTGGEVILRSGEATAGIIIPNSTTRLFPKVVSPGTITFDGVVTLNAFDAADLAETGLTVISGNGINFFQSVNDGSISVGDVPATSTKTIAPTLNEQLLLINNNGVTSFQPEAFVGTARAVTTDQVLIQYLSLGPLLSFRQEGGSVSFESQGTSLVPAIPPALGNLLRPNVYTLGSTTFDGANLTLFENFFVNSGNDLIFLGTIDSSFADVPVTFNATSGGLIILDEQVGGTAALGAVNLNAVGQIAINTGITTLPGEVPVNSGADGSISLTSTGGAVVIAGDIDTRGGLSADTGIGGNLTINSGGGGNQNIQIQSTINTRGGTMTFQDDVFFTGASTLDTTVGNSGGTITFNDTTDGSAQATMNSGTAGISFLGNVGAQSNFNLAILGAGGVAFGDPDGSGISVLLGAGANTINSLAGDVVFGSTENPSTIDILNAGTLTMNLGNNSVDFYGEVGGTNPFGMTVSSAGGIDFTGDVTLGGNFNLSSEGTGVKFNGALNGDHSVTINSILGDISLGTVGDVIPIAGFSTSSGSGTITLNGDISTEGGALSFGQKVTITSDRTIRTGLGLSPLGASISFAKGVLPSGAGIDLTINPGSNGSIIFADGLGLDGNRFNTFTLEQGGGLTIGGSSSGVFTTGNISILPKIFGSFPKSTVRFDSESGNITLNQGAVLTGLFSGANNNSDGSNFVAEALNGTLTINGVLDVSGGENDTTSGGGSGYNSGTINIEAKEVVLNTLQALGGDADTVGNGGAGGKVTITFTGGALETLTANSIITDGGDGEGIVGGIGGDVEITRESALGDILIGTISSRGGDSADNFGGQGGNIAITAVLGDLDAPTSFFTNGGEGSADAFAGLGGDVTLQATVGNISFQNQSLTLTGDGGINIIAGKSIVFATSADFTTPSNSSGGVVITSNQGALRADRRGVVTLEYGSENTGGELYMPSSAYLISNGGKVALDVKTTEGLAGAMTLSGISTSAADLNAGSIQINQDVGSVLGNVTILGSIDANGGEPASTGPLYGRNGGSVLVSGLAVSLQQINTSGSASLATATVPAFGGSGGDVTITGTSILIRAGTVPATGSFAINTSGGTGQGTGNANGGSGGNIRLIGDVTLNSPDASRTTIILNTQGGVFAAGGVSGTGGNITVTGTLTGTETTSNTLDLRYGSGTVTLGDAAADTITLGTLITAADDARSTGNLIINGELDLGTLTTYARGYSIEINGGGTIANTVTFNNTGNVALGSLTADTTFSNGVDSTAPATSLLKGNIISGTSANPGQGTPLSFGAATLVGNTTLDSNGSNVSLGTIDGPFNLDFASGIGSGVVDITSAVGASTRVGTITVSSGISQPVLFRSSVTAAGLDGAADTTISFDGNVNLTGGANLLGLTKLNNTLYESQNTTFLFTSGADSTLSDVELSLGPIEINGLGNYSFTGLFDGGVNLTLSGVGSKVFSGTVGGTTAIGTGTDAAITMSGGDVTFGTLTTASGLASIANVIFNGIATLGAGDTGTTLDSDVTLSGATISSAGSVALGNDVGIDTITLDTGTVTLTGAGAYTVNVQMTGDQRLVLGGAGTKTFVSTADVTGFTQDALSGTVTFQDNVSTSGVSLFSESTVLDNINFTSSGVGALGATAMNGVTLNGVVTLQGVGNYVFNGAMTGTALLALASEGTSTFESTVTVNRVDQLVSAGTATFRGDVTTGGVSSFAGATVLDGMVFSAGGVTTMNGVELSTGAVTLQGEGAYAIGGAVTGDQNMILGGNGAKTFDGTVSVGSALLGITQADAIGNTVRFNNTVTTAGVSTFNRGVTLGAMTFNSGGATTMNDLVTLAGAATLQGAGSYTVNGAVGGGQNLTLAEAGTKAFNSTLNLGTFSQTGGKVSLGGGVTTSGAVNLATVGTTGDILVNSTGATQTYGSVTLAGDLTTATTSGDVDAVTFGPGGVTGAGNLNVQAASLALNGVVANKGLFSAETSGNIDLGGGYLSAIEVARIASTGGARFASLVGDVTAQNLATSTSLSMQALDGETTVNGVSVNGALSMESGGAVNFNGNDTYASSLTFTGQSVSSDGSSGVLANIIVPSLGGITLTGSGNGLSYSPSGNLNVSARISVNGGDITLDPSGNFVNSYAGNPFSANSTKILTKDLFSSWPSNGAVPGLQVVYGVNSIGQVGANQVGVSTTLLAGNAGPYILEFTTGTGQPYIFAQQAAIPPVMLPAALTGGNGFAKTISYSADEIEMMTPEERSAYETQQRQVSARVILQGQSGEGEEIGAPTEGRTPQAAVPAVQIPVAPTAQVLLEGKPLAGAKSDQERGDAKRILKVRPTRAVALRSGLNVNEVMESERMAAEVSVGSAPVVQSR